jgi:hypothetical protein
MDIRAAASKLGTNRGHPPRYPDRGGRPRDGEHGFGEGSPMTVGFLHGQSAYVPDPVDPLGYVERVLERFPPDRDRLRSAGVCGACCPIVAPAAALEPRRGQRVLRLVDRIAAMSVMRVHDRGERAGLDQLDVDGCVRREVWWPPPTTIRIPRPRPAPLTAILGPKRGDPPLEPSSCELNNLLLPTGRMPKRPRSSPGTRLR